jgi:hypothetical protein
MQATTAILHVEALSSTDLERIRRRGIDDFGNHLDATVVEEAGGTPLRCCLREAVPGERVALIAYQPAKLGGPYAEVGPVFIHAEACDGYTTPGRYPDGFRGRRQLLRAYTADGRIADALIAENGDRAEEVCATFLARPEVAYIHSRNVLYGCYMFTVRRPGDSLEAMC